MIKTALISNFRPVTAGTTTLPYSRVYMLTYNIVGFMNIEQAKLSMISGKGRYNVRFMALYNVCHLAGVIYG